ncbi:MAG: hemerythrin domain-containing protein [Candidatus Limnocylindrales bacterium]
MQPLAAVSHEHHHLLWHYVDLLDELAECLECDCLDTVGLVGQMPLLREAHQGLLDHLVPHMDTVEATVFPTLERLAAPLGATVPMVSEHEEIRRLVARLGSFIEDLPSDVDRASVLTLRRILLRLHSLLKAHLAEEELYIPILEDRLTSVEEAALARALDHQAVEPL